MWQIFAFLGQQCLTVNLPLRERLAPDWNKGREREEDVKKKKEKKGRAGGRISTRVQQK